MIRNREELVSMANSWTTMAKEDLRNKIVSFMEEVGASADELAHVLAISNAEIQQIINGNGEISLLTFAKLLIATDNVLEVKPITESPFANMTAMPDPSQMPMPTPHMGGRMPMGEMPTPHMGGMPMPHIPHPNMGEVNEALNQKPLRRAAKHNAVSSSQKPTGQPIPLDELGKRELANLIVKNHWEREIDINSSSRGELIDFLEFKFSMPMEAAPMPTPRMGGRMPMTEMPMPMANENDDEEVERITEILKKEVARNPQLRNLVKKYL